MARVAVNIPGQAMTAVVHLKDQYSNPLVDPSEAQMFKVGCERCRWGSRCSDSSALTRDECLGLGRCVGGTVPSEVPDKQAYCESSGICSTATAFDGSDIVSEVQCMVANYTWVSAVWESEVWTPGSATVRHGEYEAFAEGSLVNLEKTVGYYAALTASHNASDYSAVLLKRAMCRSAVDGTVHAGALTQEDCCGTEETECGSCSDPSITNRTECEAVGITSQETCTDVVTEEVAICDATTGFVPGTGQCNLLHSDGSSIATRTGCLATGRCRSSQAVDGVRPLSTLAAVTADCVPTHSAANPDFTTNCAAIANQPDCESAGGDGRCYFDGICKASSQSTCALEASNGEEACTSAGDCTYITIDETTCISLGSCSISSETTLQECESQGGAWTSEVWERGVWTSTCPDGCDITYAIASDPTEPTCMPTHAATCAGFDETDCNANDDCVYSGTECQAAPPPASGCAVHDSSETACNTEVGCNYYAAGSITMGAAETCTDTIDEIVSDCTAGYNQGTVQQPSVTCPDYDATTKVGCILTPATFTATEVWTERIWDDLTEEFVPAEPMINTTFPVDPKACGLNTPNTCSDDELSKNTCTIGSKCVCQPGQGKDSPEAECLACPTGTYAPIAADIPCSPCEKGKITIEEGQAVCMDCEAGKSSEVGADSCTECEANQFSLPGSQCRPCPPGTEALAKGLPVCNCKEGFYFDTIAAEVQSRSWWEQGCSDCSLLMQQSGSFIECPGGPKAVSTQAERRRLAELDGESFPVTGPLIATAGNFVEATVCEVCPGATDESGNCLSDLEQRTCVTAFPCGSIGDSCFGLYATVEKEMQDHPSGPNGGAPCSALGWQNTREECPENEDGEPVYEGCTGGNRICYNNDTDWCYTMHYIALSEGVPEDELVVIDEAAAADDTAAMMLANPDAENRDQTYFWKTGDSCDINYIDAIYRRRQKTGNGVQNFCHVGHKGDMCAECEQKRLPTGELVDQEKGDDGLCHHCLNHDWFVLIRNELAVCLGYYIPYNLFLRSGRPQALKSAMFASFTFFIQTVSLLGKDTGYFMGKDYMTQEGNKEAKRQVVAIADTMGRIFSINLQASKEPTVEIDVETGEKLLQSQDLCPLHLDAYQQFYKGALFKSILILVGVSLWYRGIYHIFVLSRMHYYIFAFFKWVSGGRLFERIDWEWTTEIKVLYEHKQVDDRSRKEKRHAKGQAGRLNEVMYVPKMDRVVYGASAVMLNFHTCGILMAQTKDIEDSKDKAARVRARAQFKAVDTDRGGSLDQQEMMELLKSMGLQHLAKDRPGQQPGSGIRDLFEDIAQQVRVDRSDPSFKFDEDKDGSPLMKEDEFVHWWVSLKKVRPKKCCQGGLSAYCSKHGHSGFRPVGSVRGECIVEALDSEMSEYETLLWEREEEMGLAHHERQQPTRPQPDAPHVTDEVRDYDRDPDVVPPVWFEGDELRCTCKNDSCGRKGRGHEKSAEEAEDHHTRHPTSQPFHDVLPPLDGQKDQEPEPAHPVCACASPRGSTVEEFKRDIAIHAGIWVR